jgi:DNA-binding NtrC family response regulator
MASESTGMRRVLAQVMRVAEAEATVLLHGESGTGKGVLARVVHDRSPRCAGPFVEVNCASLPDGVLESELFGHEKGAFTGAVRQRPGRLEQARGGTLFVDEVGAADPRVQLRLLRVLQERRFERVGGDHTMVADIRVVAATNVDLIREVRAGRFREDLYYRLHVIPVQLPPLRERREDLPLLIDYFLARRQRPPHLGLDIAAEAMGLLVDYPWPGNIRELENTLERMVILCDGQRLTRADVPPEIAGWRDEPAVEALEDLGEVGYREAKEWFDRRYLSHALQRHNGVITHVADAIGMSRKYLYTRLEQLRIDPTRFRARYLKSR